MTNYESFGAGGWKIYLLLSKEIRYNFDRHQCVDNLMKKINFICDWFNVYDVNNISDKEISASSM